MINTLIKVADNDFVDEFYRRVDQYGAELEQMGYKYDGSNVTKLIKSNTSNSFVYLYTKPKKLIEAFCEDEEQIHDLISTLELTTEIRLEKF